MVSLSFRLWRRAHFNHRNMTLSRASKPADWDSLFWYVFSFGGVPQDPVSKSSERYTAGVEFEGNEAKVIGYTNARAPTVTE